MELHATVVGEGEPVCLLHGLFGRSQNLGTLARRLQAARFRVLSLDLRNHGASPRASGMDYPSMAEDVREALARHCALPAAVLGHSMGGKVAMTLALAQPGAVARLVVADIAPVVYAGHGNSAVAQAMRALPLDPGLTRRAADAALAKAVPDPATRGFLLQNLAFGTTPPAWRIGLDHIAACMTDIEGWPAPRSGARYDGPALFVSGAASDYVLPAHWQGIRALFPHAAAVRLEGAGHWLHAEQPDAFATAVLSFLAEGAFHGAGLR